MHVEDIKPDLMVHARAVERPASHAGARGLHVGTVDHVDGQRFIKLKKSDSIDGRHHWIPIAWVDDVDDRAVYLTKTAEEFEAGLLDALPSTFH